MPLTVNPPVPLLVIDKTLLLFVIVPPTRSCPASFVKVAFSTEFVTLPLIFIPLAPVLVTLSVPVFVIVPVFVSSSPVPLLMMSIVSSVLDKLPLMVKAPALFV